MPEPVRPVVTGGIAGQDRHKFIVVHAEPPPLSGRGIFCARNNTQPHRMRGLEPDKQSHAFRFIHFRHWTAEHRIRCAVEQNPAPLKSRSPCHRTTELSVPGAPLTVMDNRTGPLIQVIMPDQSGRIGGKTGKRQHGRDSCKYFPLIHCIPLSSEITNFPILFFYYYTRLFMFPECTKSTFLYLIVSFFDFFRLPSLIFAV